MTNEELVRNACQVIWTDGDVSRIGEFYAENFQANYPMTDWGKGLEGAKNLALEIRAGFPDYRERIDELIDEGDRIVTRTSISPPTVSEHPSHLGDNRPNRILSGIKL